MPTLIIAEIQHQNIYTGTLSAIQALQKVGQPIDVLIAGWQCEKIAESFSYSGNIRQILLINDITFKNPLPDILSKVIEPIAKNYSHVAMVASSLGKSLMPRLAALLDVHQISDVTAIENADTFVRPIYAGNAMATVQSTDNIKILTIRASAFPAVVSKGGQIPIKNLTLMPPATKASFVSQEVSKLSRPELGNAKIIVAGGRGLQSADNFKILEQLADKLGAAIGASRAAVDAGYVPNDYQVGQTGKIVAPQLYIAVGISGAIQHLAGMKDSKIIVAINKDPEAPIFQVADYGLVADLFEAIPALTKALDTK